MPKSVTRTQPSGWTSTFSGEVPVNDPTRVEISEGVGDLGEQTASAVSVEGLAGREQLAQGPALDVLHDEVMTSVCVAVAEDRDEVGVVEIADEAGLALEAASLLVKAFRRGGSEELERDGAVAIEGTGEEDVTHAPAAEQTQRLEARHGQERRGVRFHHES
jgi:hypothetical protein